VIAAPDPDLSTARAARQRTQQMALFAAVYAADSALFAAADAAGYKGPNTLS